MNIEQFYSLFLRSNRVTIDSRKIGKDDIFGQPKDEFMNYDVFIECQNDKRPLFPISLAEEDMTYIGYSKKLKKAVDIIGCC